jgi:hypothetical protein
MLSAYREGSDETAAEADRDITGDVDRGITRRQRQRDRRLLRHTAIRPIVD